MTPAMLAGAALPWLEGPLKDTVRAQRGHALLIHGAEGAGQLPFSIALARAWLCETPATDREGGLACGHCGSCHLAQADQVHPDLCVLLPETLHLELGWWPRDNERDELDAGKRKSSTWIGIKQVRHAIEFATQTRSRARPKVIVIHPAERMQEIAASALLKLLEEPQGGLRLVLACADTAVLLPTVRSRCHAVPMPAPDPELAAQWLRATGLDDAGLLLAASGGQPLAALARHAQGLDAALWRRLPGLVAAGDAQPLAKLPLPLAIECLQKFCHDAMAVSAGAEPRYFPPGSVPGSGARLSALAAWGQGLARTARHASHPWNAPLLLESLVAQGRQAMADVRAGGVRAGGTDSVHSRR